MRRKCSIIGAVALVLVLLVTLAPSCANGDEKEPAPGITPTVGITPTPEITPTPTVEVTPTPEITPTPTGGITPTPEITPTPTVESTPEPPAHSSAYIKFDGVDGEAESAGHERWSEIVAFSQPISKPDGGATGATRRRGDVVLEDIVVVKQLDKASPKLAEAICKGKVFPKVEIHLTGPSEGSTCHGTFYAYELTNVMITRYEISGSNPLAYALIAPAPEITMPSAGPFIVQAVDAPVEEISLNFEEIKVTYTECDSAGLSKGNVEYTWKVEEGES